MYEVIQGGVTAAKDLWQHLRQQELNIRTVPIWL